MSECIKVPGISTVTAFHSSSASVSEERNKASVDTVGDEVSSLVLYRRCFRPSAHPRPLILPHRFCFRYIRYLSAARF
jgi:hypothetical protein